MPNLWRRTADSLLGPHPRITNTDERATARLFASLMLVEVGLVFGALLVLDIVWETRFGRSVLTFADSHVVLAGNALILVAYALLRSGAYRGGIMLYVVLSGAVGVVAPFVPVSSGHLEIGLLVSSLLAVMFTSMAFSERWVTVVLGGLMVVAVFQIITSDLDVHTTQTAIVLTSFLAVVGVLIIVQRRHQRREEERHLAGARESEATYRGLFESMTDVVLIVEAGGRVIEVNQRACIQFGYSREELLGKSVYELTTLSPEAGQQLREAGRERRRLSFEIVSRRRDGTTVPVELALSPIMFRGRPAMVSAGRDLSERKQAEADRIRLEAQLRESAKLESIGLLAGGVAHDFNNLLTAIIGNLSMAEDEDLPAHVREALVECQRAADSAAALTRQLLAFSRRQVVEPRVVDLNHLIVGLRRMLVRLIGEDVELNTNLMPGLHPVKMDPGVVEQIVVNLAVNSRDAMPEGGKLVIATENVVLDESSAGDHPTLAPGEHVRLSVADTGVGMTPEIKARIFEPFFTTKPHGRGTGLGLATTYGLVGQSGGEIHVSSEPGQGATFTILLPRAPVGEVRTETQRKPMPARGGDETVLLVEDNEAILRLAELTLSSAGYRVIAASSGEQALALVEARPQGIHLVVSDVVLPGMNGRKLTDVLRTRHPALKVLFTSGYTDDKIVQRGVLDDTMAFLAKPYTPRQLLARVREVLDTPPVSAS